MLAILDRMMDAPAAKPAEPPKNPHAGAAAATGAAGSAPAVAAPAKTSLDETAELFKAVFKGDIVP